MRDKKPLNFWGAPEKFNDPFMLPSNVYIPEDFYEALRVAQYVAFKNPTFYQAARRVAAYFITNIEFRGHAGDTREKEELRSYLRDKLQVMVALLQAGTEFFIYGNSFVRIYYPFDRFLIDTRNGGCRWISVSSIGENAHFNIEDLTYSIPDPLQTNIDPSRRRTVRLKFCDRKSTNASRIKLMFIPPERMTLNMNFVSGKCEYIWMIEEEYRSAVKKGEALHQINETPMDILKAIKDNQDFKFNEGSIFHLKNDCISGLSKSGWGIPPVLLNYNALHNMQVLRCMNEAISLDYMVPFRLLSPASGANAGSDVASATNLGRWQEGVTQLIENKRKDPVALHTIPFPVQYQELGANGKSLAPVELIKAQQAEVLEGMGYPEQLYTMNMQIQQMPVAIRLMESVFMPLRQGLNRMLKWATKDILDYMEKDQIGVQLALPSVADNLEKAHIWLQLASGGEVSRETAYRAFNIDDPIEEQRRRTEEDAEIQKIKKQKDDELNREMTIGSANQVVDAMLQAQGGPGGMAPGGAPPAGGGGGGGGGAPIPGQDPGTTPLDIDQQAEEQAQQLLSIPDVGERRKIMNQISASNPLLYAVVKQKMEQMRQQGASEGRKSVGQAPPQ